MSPAQLAQLNWTVLACAGMISLLFGVLLHRTHFCTMGAVSDAVIMGSFDRLRQWALALAVSILGFGALTLAGYISPLQSIYATPSVLWLSTLLGGLLFGWGMVLASGCGAKSLVRAGAGNLKSLLVLLVMGISALITLKGILAVPRVHILETFAWSPVPGVFVGQWLSQLAGLKLSQGFFAAALCVSSMLLVWVVRDRTFLNSHNLVAGVAVGVLVCCMWLVSGVLGHGLEHPDTLDAFFLATSSRKMESFSLTAPVALGLDALMYFSDGTKRFTIGMVSVLGIFCGSFISAQFSGQFKLEAFSSRTDLLRHLVGGILMGVGGVLAMGCSIGQGLSGMSTLSIASVLATAAMLFGAVLALLSDLREAA